MWNLGMALPRSGSDQKYCESLIASLGKYFIVTVSLTVGYLFIVQDEYSRHRAISFLPGLNKLLAIRELATRSDIASNQFTKRDLPEFFRDAEEKASKPTADGTDPYSAETLDERGFTNNTISQSFLVSVISRYTQMRCRALVVRLSDGEKFNFFTHIIVGKTYTIDSKDTLWIAFDKCLRGNRDKLEVLVFRNDRDVIIGLPKYFEDEYPNIEPQAPFESAKFYEGFKLPKLLPDPINKYADTSQPVVLFHLDALEHFILVHASWRTKTFYSPNEFDAAVSRLFDEKLPHARLFGINATLPTLVAIGPFVFFLLSFEIWRRVRRLPVHGAQITFFWFATDTKDAVGRWIARAYSVTPLICGFAVYLGYVLAVQPTIIGLRELRGYFSLIDMGVAPSDALYWTYSWTNVSAIATLILVFVPIQALIIWNVTTRLLKVSKGRNFSEPKQRFERRSSVTPWKRFELQKKNTCKK